MADNIYHFSLGGTVQAPTLSDAVEKLYGPEAVLAIARSNRKNGGLFNVFMWVDNNTATVLYDDVYVSDWLTAGGFEIPDKEPYKAEWEQERIDDLIEYANNIFSPAEGLRMLAKDEPNNFLIQKAIRNRLNPQPLKK